MRRGTKVNVHLLVEAPGIKEDGLHNVSLIAQCYLLNKRLQSAFLGFHKAPVGVDIFGLSGENLAGPERASLSPLKLKEEAHLNLQRELEVHSSPDGQCTSANSRYVRQPMKR